MKGFQSHITQNINAPSQYAGLEALENKKGLKTISDMAKAFNERRLYITGRLKKMPHITCTNPQGAFYVLIDVSKLGTAANIANDLLEKINIAVVPAESFGAPGFIRLSYALSMEEIKIGMDRLEEYLVSI